MANMLEMVVVWSLYGFILLNLFGVRVVLVVKFIILGFVCCVSFRFFDINFDIYFQNWCDDQGCAQIEGFNNIVWMIDDLEAMLYLDGSGDIWFDWVNIVVYSEFGCGSMFNGFGGWDHWLANVYLLVGVDIQGG